VEHGRYNMIGVWSSSTTVHCRVISQKSKSEFGCIVPLVRIDDLGFGSHFSQEPSISRTPN